MGQQHWHPCHLLEQHGLCSACALLKQRVPLLGPVHDPWAHNCLRSAGLRRSQEGLWVSEALGVAQNLHTLGQAGFSCLVSLPASRVG